MAADPGGTPSNFPAALNQYGAKTALLGKIGSDSFGKMLLWHFVLKAHVGVDKDSGLVHTVKVTAANVHDTSMTPQC